MAFTLIDADTGYEILFFTIRGNLRIMVRHPRTHRFVRAIQEFSVGITITFDYPLSQNEKPIYMDFKMITIVTRDFLVESDGSDLEGMEETIQFVRDREIERGRDIVARRFGEEIGAIAQLAGIEYKAEPTEETNGQEYPQAHWILVWHHYKHDEQEQTGDE
jgi:hypothetical protein